MSSITESRALPRATPRPRRGAAPGWTAGAAIGALLAAGGPGCFADREPLPLDERVVAADYAQATSAGWRTVLLASALLSESCQWSPILWDCAATPAGEGCEGLEDPRPSLFSDVLIGAAGAPEPEFEMPNEDAYTWRARFADWSFLGEGAPAGSVDVYVTFRDEDGEAIPPRTEEGVPTSTDGLVDISVTLDVDLTDDVTAGFQIRGDLTLTDFESCPDLSPWLSGELSYEVQGLQDGHTFSVNGRENEEGVGPLRWELPHAALPPAEGDPDAAQEAFVAIWPDAGEWIDVGPGTLYRYSEAITVDFGEQTGPELMVEAISEDVLYFVPVDVWSPDLGVLEE